MRFADLTTLRVGGPIAHPHEARTRGELVDFVRAHPLQEPTGAAPRKTPDVLFVAGGSNLLVADDGFDGPVCLVRTRGIDWQKPDDSGVVRVTVEAGEDWDAFVAQTVDRGLSGLEALSGIPGSVGATPVQNVGAYGQEVSQTIREVLVYDRRTGERGVMSNADCGFTYRNSVFKGDDRYVVCEVVFALHRAKLSRPVRYAEVARTMGTQVGERVPLDRARETVLGLRRGKGMVLDPTDPDTRSAGSFFTNPILSAEEYEAFRELVLARLGPNTQIPGHPDGQGEVKLSAAWLIDRGGFSKGYGRGPARISGKHTLALTNPGGATTEDLLALAREVRTGVEEIFGVRLVNEPVMVGVSL